jgi:hypothetical protein
MNSFHFRKLSSLNWTGCDSRDILQWMGGNRYGPSILCPNHCLIEAATYLDQTRRHSIITTLRQFALSSFAQGLEQMPMEWLEDTSALWCECDDSSALTNNDFNLLPLIYLPESFISKPSPAWERFYSLKIRRDTHRVHKWVNQQTLVAEQRSRYIQYLPRAADQWSNHTYNQWLANGWNFDASSPDATFSLSLIRYDDYNERIDPFAAGKIT